MNQTLITIITCTLNSEKYLGENIESVKKQTYKNIEHLFIDGGSTDDTINIIKTHYQNPSLIVGQDKCLFDAFNKGLNNAQGEIIGFLNSDDILFDNQAIERIARAFINNEIDYYCSKMIIFDKEMKNYFAILGAAPHQQTLRDQLYSSTYFAHPTYYCTKEIIKKVGEFNLKYKIAADIDWLYRLEKITNKFYFDEQPLVKFRGEGGNSATKYFLGLKEEFIIRKEHGENLLQLFVVYSYHFLRRAIRFLLEKMNLKKIINYIRKVLIILKK